MSRKKLMCLKESCPSDFHYSDSRHPHGPSQDDLDLALGVYRDLDVPPRPRSLGDIEISLVRLRLLSLLKEEALITVDPGGSTVRVVMKDSSGSQEITEDFDIVFRDGSVLVTSERSARAPVKNHSYEAAIAEGIALLGL